MVTKNSSILSNKFLGINRINTSFSSSGITASDLQNVELFDTGVNSGIGIRTMKGNVKDFEFQNSDEKIINIFESVQNAEVYFFIHTELNNTGKIYLYDPLLRAVTLKYDDLAATGVSCGVDFAQGDEDWFVFTNSEKTLAIKLGHCDEHGDSDEIEVFDMIDVENNPIENPLGLVVFDGRLWVFSNLRLWYSVKEKCFDFATVTAETTTAGYIDFVKNITAIVPYLGALAVFHKDSSSLITVTSDYSYSRTEESPGGCAGLNSLVFHGTQLFFYDDSKKSIFAFSQIINGDKTLSENLAKDVQEELINIAPKDAHRVKMFSVVQKDKNEIWFLIPSETGYSDILIYDYIHFQWLKRKSQYLSDVRMINNVLYSAGGNKIFLEYQGNNFDGEFIKSYYACSPLNLGKDNTLKVLYIPPRLTLDMTYPNNFYLEYVKDYDVLRKTWVKYIKSKTIRNILYWDVHHYDSGYCYKPKQTNSIKRLPTASFQTLEMKFYTTEEAQGFSVKNLEISKIKVKQI
ncbi:MAG: hypothetical protein K6E29_00795 [Cyanobacteria bacterium RUI128]|nr:hypothetical protein [Cyanobacteria bacterium RUI128]